MEQMEKIGYKQLTTFLKIVVIFGWLMLGVWVYYFIQGFIGGA